MNKKDNQVKKLKLKKETIRTLDSKELRQVAGGATPTEGACESMECTLQSGKNHNQTFVRRRAR